MKKHIFWTIERALLLLVSLIVLFPIFWMFLTSLKRPRDAYSISLNFKPTLDNFAMVFAEPWNLGSMVLNSAIVAGVTVLISVPCASLAAYSFSRFRVKGRKILFFMVLSTQFIPAVVIVLPFFLMFRSRYADRFDYCKSCNCHAFRNLDDQRLYRCHPGGQRRSGDDRRGLTP
jgi:multiple sugar transport system permease protein